MAQLTEKEKLEFQRVVVRALRDVLAWLEWMEVTPEQEAALWRMLAQRAEMRAGGEQAARRESRHD